MSEAVVPRGKIIQKRVQKKERYARMVRIRQRKQQQISLAGFQPLSNIIEEEKEFGKHQLPMGFYIGANDGKLDTDMSLLNRSYISNCIEVAQDVDKILSVNLNKKSIETAPGAYDTGFLEEWEKRDHPYWKMWTNRLKNFTTSFNNFIEKNKTRFSTGKLDKLEVQKHNDYLAKCRELTTYKPCMEVKKSFNANSFSFSKITYNSKFINKLHYDFNEFIDLILKVQGINRLRHSKIENGGMFGAMMDHFDKIFHKPIISPPRDVYFYLKGGELQRLTTTVMMAGHFVKNSAEVSFFLSFDVHEPIPRSPSALEPYSLHMAKNILNDQERRQFVEKYYPLAYLEFITEWKMKHHNQRARRLSIETKLEETDNSSTNERPEYSDGSYEPKIETLSE